MNLYFRFSALLVTGVLALTVGSGCTRPVVEPRTPRLVLLYATCSLNKNYLSPYNENVGFTPNLERLAKRGLVFDRHHTEAGQSGIAFASLFTGTQATHHRIFQHPTRLPESIEVIPEAFAAAKFETHAYLKHMMATVNLNYHQGTDSERAHKERLAGDSPGFLRLLDRLEQSPDERAFVMTNFTVTHQPYVGTHVAEFCELFPGECAIRDDSARYDRLDRIHLKENLSLTGDTQATIVRLGLTDADVDDLIKVLELKYKANVWHLDTIFGEVVAAIEARGLLDDSLIAFTSDHGEVLYRENSLLKWTHGLQLTPEVINVAFILAGPGAGVTAGVYDGVSRSIDVFPTLAGLSGITLTENAARGVDLTRAVRGEEKPKRLLAFSHSSLFNKILWNKLNGFLPDYISLMPDRTPEHMWVAVRDGDMYFKYRRIPGQSWETVAFDLARDPGETRNLFDETNPNHTRKRDQLLRYRAELQKVAYATLNMKPPDRAEEALRALGYIQ